MTAWFFVFAQNHAALDAVEHTVLCEYKSGLCVHILDISHIVLLSEYMSIDRPTLYRTKAMFTADDNASPKAMTTTIVHLHLSSVC